ncbi:MAG: type II toxin-antitoxin system HipA family toxin [bacterium]
MPRPRKYEPLDVYVNGRLVGEFCKQSDGVVYFEYAPDWLEWEHAFPVSISLPLREDRYIGEPVIAVFDNLLPDVNTIRNKVARRLQADGTDTFSLLSAIGQDCVGALQFLPKGKEPNNPNEIEGNPIDDREIAKKLRNLSEAPLGLDDEDAFRISIAGAQEKWTLLQHEDQWKEPTGATPTTHILKPKIGVRHGNVDLTLSVENERFCLEFIRAMGLPAANTHIETFNGEKTLVIERFDRRFTGDGRLLRVPQEDMGQALSVPPTRKYERDGGPGMSDIFEFLKAADDPTRDRLLFLKAQLVNWLLGAPDGHAKNFSIFIKPGSHFELTPLYDVMSVQPNVDNGELRQNKMKLAMAVGDNRHYKVKEVVPRHFRETASEAGLSDSKITSVFESINQGIPDALDETRKHMPDDFPGELMESIVEGIKSRKRLLEHDLSE